MGPKESQKSGSKRHEVLLVGNGVGDAPTIREQSPFNVALSLALALAMLASAAVASRLSQMLLAPEYGSIPAGVNHDTAMLISPALGFLLFTVRPVKSTAQIQLFLMAWTMSLPTIHWMLSWTLKRAGPVAGPIVLGASTCHVVVLASSYIAASATATLKEMVPRPWGAAVHGLAVAASAAFVSQLDRWFTTVLPDLILAWNSSAAIGRFDPIKAYVVFAVCHISLLLTSQFRNGNLLRWLVILAFLSLLLNPHLISPLNNYILNRTLQRSSWALIDRQWSNTGYLSVLENRSEHYRVLRCDHSLLGGEWLITSYRRDKEGWTVNEPIYHVFEMLEAVRLIETQSHTRDSDAKALVVGLGIGTAPKALIEHGVDTTIIELDPTVHSFATKHFGLPNNLTAIIQDAVSWVHQESEKQRSPKYNYILHDVFTGGAEPLVLFTHSFIQGLRRLLQPDGVIAINYAGDLGFPLTQKILHTVETVFDGQCRAFGDAEPSSDGQNFINMVLFCRNTPGSIQFRKPTTEDFLGSISRRHYLLPNPDHEISFPRGAQVANMHVLTNEEISEWRPRQVDSALRHWRIMREVLPEVVWQTW